MLTERRLSLLTFPMLLLLVMQVAYHCAEQGRVLDALRDRYAELANALFLGISSLTQQDAALSCTLLAAASATAADRALIASLRRQLADKQAEAEGVQSALAASQAKLEQLEQESAEEMKQAIQQITQLKQQLWHCREDLEASNAAAERAATAAREELDAQAAAAEEARRDMLQRLGFLTAQLAALR